MIRLKNDKVEQLKWCYQQLGLIVSDGEINDIMQDEECKKVEELFLEKIPNLIRKSAPADIYEILKELKYNYEYLNDCIVYGSLKRKNVIGLGGGFSTGKSSFLNTLLNSGEILPENINPSTSVPTYIINGPKNKVQGINIFKKKMELDLYSINAISHGFGAVSEDMKSIELGHILRNLVLETPLFSYKHIAFLDTPGYSKPDDANYSAKTDDMVARQQLNTTNYIFWFSPVSESGSLSEKDIAFMKSLRNDMPLTIICSKANRRTAEQRNQIKQEILHQVKNYQLNVENIYFFDTETPDALDASGILNLIERLDQTPYDGSTLGKNMKKFFLKMNNYYENLERDLAQKVNRMNQAILCIDDEPKIRNGLQALIQEMNSERTEVETYKSSLEHIEVELFRLVQSISNRYDFAFVIPNVRGIMSELQKENEILNTQTRNRFAHKENSFSKLAKGRFEEC